MMCIEVRPEREGKERELRKHLIWHHIHRIMFFSPISVQLQTSIYSFISILHFHILPNCLRTASPCFREVCDFFLTCIIENKKSDADGALADDFDNPG